MTTNAVVQITIYVVVLLALVRPLGAYMARVYQGEAKLAARLLGPLERLVYRAVGAGALLRRNLLVFGLGGIVVPFVGIKLIDLLLVAMRLA